jgi:uncharacterized spore protein YtfJ
MDNDLTNIVGSLLDGVSTMSRSETIIGEPQKAGEATVIPVHRLKVAFGAGSSKAGAHRNDSGGDWVGEGAGGAVEVDPVGAIAIGKDGKARFLSVDDDERSSWANLFREVPELVRKVAVAVGDRASNKLGAATEKEADKEAEALPEKSG